MVGAPGGETPLAGAEPVLVTTTVAVRLSPVDTVAGSDAITSSAAGASTMIAGVVVLSETSSRLLKSVAFAVSARVSSPLVDGVTVQVNCALPAPLRSAVAGDGAETVADTPPELSVSTGVTASARACP